MGIQESGSDFGIPDVDLLTELEKRDFVERYPPDFARRLLLASFLRGAVLKNDDPHAPYIEWKPMNREPEGWVALAKAKLAAYHLAGRPIDSVIFVPSSCTWEREHWIQYGAFSHARYPRVLRAEQLSDNNREAAWQEYQVRSYTRNKHPDGSRGTEAMLFEMGVWYGNAVLLVDDVFAKGYSTLDVAHILKNNFGVKHVYAMATIAKRMEGGIEHLRESPDIDGLIAPIVVEYVDVASRKIFTEAESVVEIH